MLLLTPDPDWLPDERASFSAVVQIFFVFEDEPDIIFAANKKDGSIWAEAFDLEQWRSKIRDSEYDFLAPLSA